MFEGVLAALKLISYVLMFSNMVPDQTLQPSVHVVTEAPAQVQESGWVAEKFVYPPSRKPMGEMK